MKFQEHINPADTLTALVKKDDLKFAKCIVYVGYVECRLKGRYMWRDFGGCITRLTEADAMLDANIIKSEYLNLLEDKK